MNNVCLFRRWFNNAYILCRQEKECENKHSATDNDAR